MNSCQSVRRISDDRADTGSGRVTWKVCGGCNVAADHVETGSHGVAFLCEISTPSLSAQGEQRRSAFFNIRRDISRNGGEMAYAR